jgi:hypothetical protein
VAAALIVRGWRLFADDIVALREEPADVLAFPGPPLMNVGDGCGVRPEAVGVPLARFGDETWVRARRDAEAPQRLAAVCVLERAPGRPLELEQVEPSVRALLPHSLGFPHMKRLVSRFELLSDLAERVPLYRLSAPLSASPAEVADLLPIRERAAA